MPSFLSRFFGGGGTPGLALGAESVAADEDAVAEEMISLIRDIMQQRSREGGDPLRRFNQPKSHGCFDARLEVGPLPTELAQGLFARPATYPAKVRFASATEDDDRKSDLRGFSMQVHGLAGGAEQHFLFNSHPALFAADPHEFLDFIRATAKGRLPWFFVTHPGAALVVLRARDKPASLFDIPYWSTTPSRLGDDPSVAVKHAVVPCSDYRGEKTPGNSPHYHAERLRMHLDAAPACFDFKVQFQTDPQRMPIEDASVVWPESESPLRHVARIVIEQQDWRNAAAMQACERMLFNPWTGLPAHRPLGGINRVRNRVYKEIGEFRTAGNAPTSPANRATASNAAREPDR